MKSLVFNSIDYSSPDEDLVIKYVNEIQKDYPEINSRGNDEITVVKLKGQRKRIASSCNQSYNRDNY